MEMMNWLDRQEIKGEKLSKKATTDKEDDRSSADEEGYSAICAGCEKDGTPLQPPCCLCKVRLGGLEVRN